MSSYLLLHCLLCLFFAYKVPPLLSALFAGVSTPPKCLLCLCLSSVYLLFVFIYNKTMCLPSLSFFACSSRLLLCILLSPFCLFYSHSFVSLLLSLSSSYIYILYIYYIYYIYISAVSVELNRAVLSVSSVSLSPFSGCLCLC